MIDRYLLRYFLAVIDNGTFTAAAAQVNVSQPTLSAGIAKLEREAGARLLRRNSQRVELTEAGARFATHARRIEREFHLAQAAIDGTASLATLRIGILSTLATRDLTTLTNGFVATGDEVRVEMVEGTERTLAQYLARGRIDVALTLLRGDRDGDMLRSEGYALALPASHPLAAEASLPGEAMAGETMIVRRHCEALAETSRYFTQRGVRPFFALRTTNDDRALAMVSAGLGVTVVPASHAHPGVVMPTLAGFDLQRRIGLVWGDHAAHQRTAHDDLLRGAFAA